ncbi:hypothetical protein [Roseovarius aquimarinus]|uniref:Uncharacterized protein n=1 Tax=Roseovarius aquimarinus TaxID=1229156 RepID=A0ABW7I2X4_9RHOB
MTENRHSAGRTYFVTLPYEGPLSLSAAARFLHLHDRAAIGECRITAMVALPGSILAVLTFRTPPDSMPHLLQTRWLDRIARRPGGRAIRAKEITTQKMLRERIDHCHFAPAQRALVRDPVHWAASTIRDHAPSEMILT